MSGMTLTDFLLCRIVEDEVWARSAKDASDDSPWSHGSGELRGDVFTRGGLRVAETRSANVSRHIARHDPARVLAGCEAKRRIVKEAKGHETCGGGYDECSEAALLTLRHLSTAYADHPDYDEAWRP